MFWSSLAWKKRRDEEESLIESAGWIVVEWLDGWIDRQRVRERTGLDRPLQSYGRGGGLEADNGSRATSWAPVTVEPHRNRRQASEPGPQSSESSQSSLFHLLENPMTMAHCSHEVKFISPVTSRHPLCGSSVFSPFASSALQPRAGCHSELRVWNPPETWVRTTPNTVSFMNLIPTVHKQRLFSRLDILTSSVKILNNAENGFRRYKTEIVQNSNNKTFFNQVQ